ncbi:hypothetical protein GALMADRAFT_239023 [Galerina marginata CBS 339.88]|uniref:F-box domain-containing protein n=1 Tax=Galerina marginata (strain CBS 339.88) TaxID=685588 RepID=A0A067TIY1_GALM3|nr:hypothetical protein GALMADRAFT_239023 [Galerina marginata CBS 339.88]
MNKVQNTSKGRSTSPQFEKATIASLAPELLSIIFKFVHDGSPQTNKPRDVPPSWTMKIDEDLEWAVNALVHPDLECVDFQSPTLFPYSLAAVSPYWSEILSSYPEFWTLVVFFIDSRHTSLAEASLILKRSRKLPIHVVITRREGFRVRKHPDLHEKCQIAALVDILQPHWRRCESLHIDAHLSSSLPVVPTDFSLFDVAPQLFLLELIPDCLDEQENHGRQEGQEGQEGQEDEEEREEREDILARFYTTRSEFAPGLRFLVVDGHNFRRGNEELELWIPNDSNLEYLTVVRHHPPASSTEEEPYTLTNFCNQLDDFASLRYLKLQDIRFKYYAGPHLTYDLSVQYLHLVEVESDFIDAFFEWMPQLSLSVLHITRSSLPKYEGVENATLILEEITPECDLHDALGSWEGETLCIDNCKQFSDQVLEEMAYVLGPVPEDGEPEVCMSAPCLRRLILCRLSELSIRALKALVDLRNRMVDYNHPNWRTTTSFGPAIRSLAVVHCKVETLSAADEQWFRSRLVEFYWVN